MNIFKMIIPQATGFQRKECHWSDHGIWIFTCVFLAGACALIVSSIVIVQPYRSVMGYEETNCSMLEDVEEIKAKAYKKSCSCGQNCGSIITCVLIYVNVSIPELGNITTKFYRSETDLDKKECTYNPGCRPEVEQIDHMVWTYVNDLYALHAPFPCFYNPKEAQHTQVFGLHQYTGETVTDSMLWSSITLLLGLLGLFVSICCCRRSRHLGYYGTIHELDIDAEKQQTKQMFFRRQLSVIPE